MFNKFVFMIKTKFLWIGQVYSTCLKNTNVKSKEYIYISHAIVKLIYNWQFEEKNQVYKYQQQKTMTIRHSEWLKL